MLKIKNSYNVIGVMSGTSLDGIDICFCNFSHENQQWKFKIHNTDTVSYEKVGFLSFQTLIASLKVNCKN